ncbi:MAG: DUF4157 domain-containing protein [Candidatus Nitrotoga sp.]|nr:DUF4157 domain-containing protein [Candidatus Nitrotoga sp.]
MSTAAPLQNTVAKSPLVGKSPHAGLLLRRKCACGGSASSSLSSECGECNKKRLQKKLSIGASNDPLEQEADRIADQVLAAPAHSTISGIPPRIQRHSGQSSGQADTAPASVDRVLAGSGRPLDTVLQQDMGQRFGHDFSQVRVHTGAAAEQSARDVNAQAYTVGDSIVFGAGEFAPGSSEGRRLIAHELTHVVQQSGPDESTRGARQSDEKRGLSPFPMSAISHARSVLSRQEDPTLKQMADDARKVPGPSANVPGEAEDKFEDAVSKPSGRLKNSAPATWGWGSPETDNLYQECTVAPMARERFIQFRATLPKGPPHPQRKNPSEGPGFVLGATWPDVAAAIPPRIAAEPVQEDGKTLYRLKPTYAGMAPIKSASTQAGTFQEGITTFAVYESTGKRVCPDLGGRAPLFWRITEGGAQKIWAGEMEHCSDIRAAFEVTLALYASVINNEAAAERRYRTDKSVISETKKRLNNIPLDPVDMLNTYGTEIEKTRLRDTLHWHDGVTSNSLTPQENNCKGYLGTFSESSFPEVGDGPGQEKHPPQEVLQGPAGKTKGTP